VALDQQGDERVAKVAIRHRAAVVEARLEEHRQDVVALIEARVLPRLLDHVEDDLVEGVDHLAERARRRIVASLRDHEPGHSRGARAPIDDA
jgi:hypothetical protein